MKHITIGVMAVLLGLVLVACVGDDGLAGLWIGVEPDDYQLELAADGTGREQWVGTAFDMPITWTVEGDELCITYEDDSGDCRRFTVDGDRMALEGASGGGMARLERWTE